MERDIDLDNPLDALKMGNAWDANLYSYVGNDPLNMIDPNGQFPIQYAALIGGGLGFAGGGTLAKYQGLGQCQSVAYAFAGAALGAAAPIVGTAVAGIVAPPTVGGQVAGLFTTVFSALAGVASVYAKSEANDYINEACQRGFGPNQGYYIVCRQPKWK